jgi:hypothetical protein
VTDAVCRLLPLTCLMGIQNAMVRVHGVPDLATNVMTVTFTGIIADSTPAGGTNRNWRRRVTRVYRTCIDDRFNVNKRPKVIKLKRASLARIPKI